MGNIINLDKINNHNDIIDAFIKLREKSIEIGTPIALNTTTSEVLELYYHEDHPNRILVDKFVSNRQRKCPRCKGLLSPSDVAGYKYVCYDCDENFYGIEVGEEEWNKSNVLIVNE